MTARFRSTPGNERDTAGCCNRAPERGTTPMRVSSESRASETGPVGTRCRSARLATKVEVDEVAG